MENAEGYVAEILHNYCLKRLCASREQVSEEVLAMQPDSRPDPAQQAEARSRAELMRCLIASLPPQPARVLTLQVYGEMDSAEIAAPVALRSQRQEDSLALSPLAGGHVQRGRQTEASGVGNWPLPPRNPEALGKICTQSK